MERPLISAIRRDAPKHASIPFWSWNDRLEPEALRKQIRNMKHIGMGGFFMHARGGLETEYLSDEWFCAINACIDEAKKQGMEAWAYDENGWPSGFAGGILLKDPWNCALALVAKTEDAYPADEVFCVYVQDGEKVRPAKKDEKAKSYLVVRIKTDYSYTDTMDPSVTAKFLKETHALYKSRIASEDFGTVMPGFFTDEPQYFRWATPYSHILADEFYARYGYDVRLAVPALFTDYAGAEEHRYDYFSLCHDLFINNFIRPIYEWCGDHGIQLTGHAVEETSLAGQMMCCGGVMPFYEYEHIPGMDYLCRNLTSDLAPKQLGSVCAQLGRKRVLSEMFAACGWDVSPRELKDIAELQYAGGVNLTCQHLFPFSMRGQRKRDYPCHYSDILCWQEKMADFNAYFNNLGSALSQGTEIAPVLVIHPMHTAYLYYKREDERKVNELNAPFEETLKALGDAGVLYHFGDERIMARHGSAEGNCLRIGACSYTTVVLPSCETLDKSTVALLRKYLSAGGRLCIVGNVPARMDGHLCDLSALRPNISFEEVLSSAPVKVTCGGEYSGRVRVMERITEDGHLLFVKNLSGKDLPGLELSLSDFTAAERINVSDLTVSAVVQKRSGDRLIVALPLEKGESALLAERKDIPPCNPQKPGEFLSLDLPFTLSAPLENQMALDRAKISLNGGEFTELRPIERIRDELLRDHFEGRLTLCFPFTVNVLPENLRVVAEPAKNLTLTLNGKPLSRLSDTRLDPRFISFDAAGAAKCGENALCLSMDYYQAPNVYEVLDGDGTESLRNCLSFTTEVEAVYLFGSFGVATDPDKFTDALRFAEEYFGEFALDVQPEVIDPTDLVRSGYPFYGGKVSLSASFNHKNGDPTELKLGGHYAVCEVELNGHRLPDLLFTDRADLSEHLREGENRLTLTLYNSYRNLFGPHHFRDPEPFGVGPMTFSFERLWKDGECAIFRPRYAFVRFGIDKK